MKIILSRKGFDSSPGNGQVASPILPDGRLCYLPIPDKGSAIKYSELSWDGTDLGRIVENLTGRRIRGRHGVHLDPDIDRGHLPRKSGWRPMFGQVDVAQRHLEKGSVSKGDVFLFFGWFRLVDSISGRLAYVPYAPDLHVIFGWLQVGAVVKAQVLAKRKLKWASYHPHVARYSPHIVSDTSYADTVYIAGARLKNPVLKTGLPGGGVFRQFKPCLCLTAPGCRRSQWRMPAWLHPLGREQSLSYHSDITRWRRGRACVYLDSVAKGQEFILDCDYYPEAVEWLNQLLRLA